MIKTNFKPILLDLTYLSPGNNQKKNINFPNYNQKIYLKLTQTQIKSLIQ